MSELPQPIPAELNCPSCQGGILVELADQPQIAQCPHCGQTLVLPGRDGNTAAIAQIGQGISDQPAPKDQPPEEVPADDDELDGLRIRRVAAMRRAAYRSRGYYLMISAILLAVGGQFIYIGILMLHRQGWHWSVIWRLFAGCLSVAATLAVYRQARVMGSEGGE